jgi:hypothetical protein
MSDTFPIKVGLEEDIAIAFQLCFRECLRKVQGNQSELKLNGTRQLLIHADCANINIIHKNTKVLRGLVGSWFRSKPRENLSRF